jgi:vacuolar protein sorting-associated protein 35
MIIGALQSTRVFGPDNYDTLCRKCILHASKLLKRPDQCRAICMCAHLYWHTPIAAQGEDETTELYRDEKRVLEVLHRAIKIADSCLDAVVNVQLFVEILNRYIYYFERCSTEVCCIYHNTLHHYLTLSICHRSRSSMLMV